MVVDLFNAVTEKGRYRIGYLDDGWTREVITEAGSPSEAMMATQNLIGDICGVTYVEKC